MSRRDRRERDARERRVAFLRAVGDIDPRLELDALLQRVADVALSVGGDAAVVAMRDDQTGWRFVQAGEAPDSPEETAERIASAGRITREPGLFGLSLQGRAGIVGALWLVSSEPVSDEDEALVESLSHLAAAAIADATLFATEAEAAELARRKEQSEASFASMVSHELRSPLAAIRGFGRLLLERDGSVTPEERREFLEAVVRQADHMATLVDDVLDAAQIEAGAFRCTMDSYDAEALLNEAVEDATASYPGRRVTLAVSSNLPPAEGDRARLKQVLLNILSNACRYSPAESPVTVSAASTRDSLEIAIADEGPGVSVEDRDRIFRRFTRLATRGSQRVKGAGLGLYIAQQIVEMHGGRITVTSEPGAGATFCVTLPLQPPPAGEERRPG